MITPLPLPPSRADSANFSSRADSFMAQLPTFATEANSLAADVNSKQTTASTAATTATTKAGEALTSANNAATSASNASTSATNSSTSATTAQNWAIKTDGPVSGGEYSAKYWGQIAQGFVVGTLFDDTNTSAVKTWSSSKISTWAAKVSGGNTFTGAQNVFNYSQGNPALATNYAIKTTGSYGGGYLLEDTTNYISMYSVSGTLNLGFGGNATSIASKYSFTAAGDFTATGRVTSAGITSSNTGTFVDQVNVSGTGIPSLTVSKSGQNAAHFYSSNSAWGLYSDSGGYIVMHNRSDGKNYFSGIAAGDIWKFSAGASSFGSTGYMKLPNGLILQWGVITAGLGPINFPLTFPNAVLNIQSTRTTTHAGDGSGSEVFVNSSTLTTSGFSYGFAATTTYPIYWFATGY